VGGILGWGVENNGVQRMITSDAHIEALFYGRVNGRVCINSDSKIYFNILER